MNKEFEILAKLHGLDLRKNEKGFLDPKTTLAFEFFDARQAKIDKLEEEVQQLTCTCRINRVVIDSLIHLNWKWCNHE